MNQLDIRRKYILQAEAIDRVGVPAANFHQAVVAIGIGEAADFFGGLGDQLGVAEFIDEFHA